MRFRNKGFGDIADLVGSRKGCPMWIAGSDPTLDGYPNDYLDGKESITLHLAHVKFPRASFRYSSEYDRSEYLLQSDPEYRALPLIAALPMYGKTRRETEALLSGNNRVYFHRMVNYLPTGVRGEVDPEFTKWKVAQTIAGKATVWGSHGSCLHTCVYMALLLGASEIHVIGSGHGLANDGGKDHFGAVDAVHQAMRVGDTFSNPKIAYPVIAQTIALKRACESNGVPFHWHERYDSTGERFITINEDELVELRERARRSFPAVKRLYWALVKRPITRIISKL